MKTKIVLCLIFIAACSFASFAQSVAISKRKVIYTRPKPIADFKKTFTVNYPRVKASTAALSRKIETTISYAKVMEFNLQEEKTEMQWLEEADYEIGYNKNGILSIMLMMSGAGAYPSTFSKTVVVDLKTGNQVKAADIFTDLVGLAAEVKKRQQTEIAKTKEEYKKESETADFDGSEYFDNADFTTEFLENFSVGETGITFKYDYGFPHVVQALQPNGEYLFTWAQLKSYIKKGGLLEKFNR